MLCFEIEHVYHLTGSEGQETLVTTQSILQVESLNKRCLKTEVNQYLLLKHPEMKQFEATSIQLSK